MERALVLVVAALGLAATSFGQVTNPVGGFGDVKAVSVKQGEAIPAGELRYRILGIKTGQKEYAQRFDQRALRQLPGFASDQLVIVDLEVENVGAAALDPAMFAFRVIDSEGGVSPSGSVDTRLQSTVLVQGYARDERTQPRAELAPKAKRKMAVVFSMPREAKPTGLQVYVSQTTVQQGAVVEWMGPLLATVTLEKE